MLHRILVPTDFSLKSLSALDVIRMLREHINEVVFVHVVERSRSQTDLDDKMRTAGLRLQELVDEMKIFGIKATYHVRKGAASKEILRLAEKEDVSLIVMAKTGAGLVKGLVMGSTAQNVTLNAERTERNFKRRTLAAFAAAGERSGRIKKKYRKTLDN